MDGTGKTTHSRGLIDHLRMSGIKCRYVWFGNAYFFSYPFMIICRILGLTNIYHVANGLSVSEHQYYKNKTISQMWPWVQFLDAVIFVNLRVKLLLLRGFTIVCDRFIPDILVELMIDVNNDKLYEELVGRLMLRLMPRSSLVIMLCVDEKTSWQRKDDVPELRYLSRRKKKYQLIGHSMRIPIVSAEGPIASVQGRLVYSVDGLSRKTNTQ